jgi:hypothetical protein
MSKDRAVKTIIVEGVTQDGRKFRPSDWAERMSGMLSTFGGDHRIHYSPQLRPISLDGVKCIAVDPELEQSNPTVFSSVMDFAQRNNLNIIETLNDPE